MGAVILSFAGEALPVGAEGVSRGFREEVAPVVGGALESLRGSSLRDDFYCWRGASGRRYVCSVFPREDTEIVAQFRGVALIGVSRRGRDRKVLCVLSSRLFALRDHADVDEWHVHFGDDVRKLRDLASALLH